AKTKMHPWIGRRSVTTSAEDIRALPNSIARQKNLRADRISGTFGPAHQLQFDPVIFVLRDVAQERRSRIDVVQHNIDFPVVEEVPECCSSRRDDGGEPASSRWRHFFKSRSIQISKKLGPLCPS